MPRHCPNCSAQVPIEDQKLGAQRITHCPKCNRSLESGSLSPASEKSALALGGSPATTVRRNGQIRSAPLFEIEPGAAKKQDTSMEREEFMRLLGKMLGKDLDSGLAVEREAKRQRKVLVCVSDEFREKIALPLAKDGYQVFVALDTEQAVERMRDNRLDVVLLDPQFDATEQGAAFVVREVNVLRPAQRRRVFFVLLSPSLRTLDAHGAFLNNVNAIVNLKDLDDLVGILDHSLRGFNDLYHDFNNALKLAAI